MYSIDGEFGKVRHIRIPLCGQTMDVPFFVTSGGWHCCNDQYHIQRDGSQTNHLLLFSLSEGGMIQLEGSKPMKLPACSVTWLPPGLGHKYGTIKNGLWEFYWLHFEDTECLYLEKAFGENYVLPISNMDAIDKEFEKMIYNRFQEYWEFQIEASRLLGDIYHLLLRESMQPKLLNNNMDEMIHMVMGELEAHCEKDWNLSELSEKYYISVPQLIRRFKKQTGMTPYTYLMSCRLRKAEMYLMHTNMTVEEIGIKTGFPNTSNFIYQFQKEKGVTPGKYKK